MLKIFQSPSSKRFLCKFAAVLISAGVVVSCSKKDSSTSSSSSTKSDEKEKMELDFGEGVFTKSMGMNFVDPSYAPEQPDIFSDSHIHRHGEDSAFQSVRPARLHIEGRNFNKTLDVLGTAGDWYVQMVKFPLDVPLSMTLNGTRGGDPVSPMTTEITFRRAGNELQPASLEFAETRNIRQRGMRLIMRRPKGDDETRKFPFIIRTDQSALDYSVKGSDDAVGKFTETGARLTGIAGSRKLTLNYTMITPGKTEQTIKLLRDKKLSQTRRLSYEKSFIVKHAANKAGLIVHEAWDVGIDQKVDNITADLSDNSIDRSTMRVKLTARILDEITPAQRANLRYEWSSPDNSLTFTDDSASETFIADNNLKGQVRLKVTDNSTGAWTKVNYDVDESSNVDLYDFWDSLSNNWKRMLRVNIGLPDNTEEPGADEIQNMLNLNTIQWTNPEPSNSGRRIKTLAPLKYFKDRNINTLSLWGNEISDLTPLDNVSSTLTYLNLRTNKITNVSKLRSMTNLTVLLICENQIEDVDALGSLTNLNRLWLDNTPVRSVHPELNDLSNLRRLLLYTTPNIDQAEVNRLKTVLPEVNISYY